MMELLIASAVVSLYVVAVVMSDRRRFRLTDRARRDEFGYISRRDLIKYE
jgi:hypothetical protein